MGVRRGFPRQSCRCEISTDRSSAPLVSCATSWIRSELKKNLRRGGAQRRHMTFLPNRVASVSPGPLGTAKNRVRSRETVKRWTSATTKTRYQAKCEGRDGHPCDPVELRFAGSAENQAVFPCVEGADPVHWTSKGQLDQITSVFGFQSVLDPSGSAAESPISPKTGHETFGKTENMGHTPATTVEKYVIVIEGSGVVYDGDDESEARGQFKQFVKLSKDQRSITLLKDGQT